MKDSNRNNDFKSFTDSSQELPSKELQDSILKQVNSELNPDHKLVFLKLVSIQAFIGFITLTFCPQFELSLTNNNDLFHYFHHSFGASICMMICGSIFVGTGAFFATTILKVSELRLIRKNRFLYYLSITGIFISTLILFGANVYLGSLGFWLIGAFVSSSFFLEINRYIHNKLIQA